MNEKRSSNQVVIVVRRDRYTTTNHYANQGKYQHIQGMKFVILMVKSCSIQEKNIENKRERIIENKLKTNII